jgi:hypothetical protein
MRLRLVVISGLALLAPLLAVIPSTASASPVSVPNGARVAKSTITSGVTAAATATPTPVRTHAYDGGKLQGSYGSKVSAEDFSSAVVGNVTGHTDGDTDVIAGFIDGTIHVWDERTNRQEFVVQTGGSVRSSPALVRTRAGGGLLVLTSNASGIVVIYSFTHGHVATVFRKQVPAGLNGFFGTPTMADLDNNGKMWIIATSYDQHLYVWDLGGHNKPGFPYWAQDTIWSSPTVAKMPGDPFPRIIFGYDCGGVPAQSCYQRWHSHGGVLMVMQHNGKPAPGFPVFITGQVVWSTPAVASLYGTSAKQIIVGTGLFWPSAGRQTWVFDSVGHRLAVVPMSGRTFSSPAIGDVLGTGRPQIIEGTEDGYTDIIDNKFHRYTHTCTSILASCVNSHASPIIGDLYGNGQQEIVAEGGNHFVVINRTGHAVSTVQIPETLVGLAATPTLANVDGRATLFFAVMGKGPGGNHAAVYAYGFPTAAGPSAWPMFKGDYSRSGAPVLAVPNPAPLT